jgi:hypothetical protein
MNIVYLIGNGFDLNLGMKTSYRDFCEYYTNLPKDNDAEIVKRLKREIKDNIENWSDFELSLGNFLDEKMEAHDAVVLYNDLIDHLRKYIETEEKKYIFDNTQKNIFCEYLCKPYTENRLLFAELSEVKEFMLDQKHKIWDVKIITFNYTRSIEKLLGMDIYENIQIGTHSFDRSVILSAVEHIHGFTNSRLILGVNDISQIANDKFHSKTSVINRYIKLNSNNIYRLNHDKKCQQWIDNAELVCLFGLSFGDTDKRWWQMVSGILQAGCKVIIFEYMTSNLPDENHGADMDELKEEVKNRFLSKTTIYEDSRDDIKNNMYVVFNTEMFKFNKLKKV